MKETALTLKFRGVEAELLEKMIRIGLFNTKSEALRSALIHYCIEIGLLGKDRKDHSSDRLIEELRSIDYVG